MGGLSISETSRNAAADSADALLGKDLEGGAFKVVEETQPYIAASALYGDGKGDLTAADKEADHIIAFLGSADEKVMQAGTLGGPLAKLIATMHRPMHSKRPLST